MKKMFYYAILVALFLILWAIMITVMVLICGNRYKPGRFMYYIGFAIIFAIFGFLKKVVKKWAIKKGWV